MTVKARRVWRNRVGNRVVSTVIIMPEHYWDTETCALLGGPYETAYWDHPSGPTIVVFRYPNRYEAKAGHLAVLRMLRRTRPHRSPEPMATRPKRRTKDGRKRKRWMR